MIETIREVFDEHEGGMDAANKVTVSLTNGDVTDMIEGVTALVVVMEKDGTTHNCVVGMMNAEVLHLLSKNASECVGRVAKKAGLQEELAAYALLWLLEKVTHEAD